MQMFVDIRCQSPTNIDLSRFGPANSYTLVKNIVGRRCGRGLSLIRFVIAYILESIIIFKIVSAFNYGDVKLSFLWNPR
jgi:hypothetical protein